MQQAARDQTTQPFYMKACLLNTVAQEIFTNPTKKQTEDYITGRFDKQLRKYHAETFTTRYKHDKKDMLHLATLVEESLHLASTR